MACLVPDTRRESRFPAFIEEAQSAGLGAVFSFPLRHDDQALGTMDLYRSAPGMLADEHVAAASMIAGVVSALLINAQHRSELELIAERLGTEARRDPLTQLSNRTVLSERLELAIKRWERSERPFAVLFIDIDNFKLINERHGHATGDQLLSMFAARLSAAVRPVDLVARLGGDEFAAVCEDLDDFAEPQRIVARIADDLRTPFTVDDTEVTLSASIGIARSGPENNTAASILRASDEAMYVGKRASCPPSGRVDAIASRTEPDDAEPWTGTLAAMGGDLGKWHETLIEGELSDEVAFSSVLANSASGDLLITQYDRQAMLLRRYQWEPRGSAGAQLTVTDWDDQQLLNRPVQTIPAPPSDRETLKRLLEQIDT